MNLEELKQKIEQFQAKSVAKSEITAFSALVLTVLKNAKTEFKDLSDKNMQTIKDSIAYLEDFTQKQSETFSNDKKSMMSEFEANISILKDLISKVQTIKPVNGTDGVDGKDADEEKIVAEVLSKLPPVEEIDAGEIADKLESLVGDKRLDASAIKNLPEFTQSRPNGGGWRNLFQLHDTNINSPTNNQVLKYNSTTKLWENGAASGGGTWGSITGTLSDQTDLQTALNLKLDSTTAASTYQPLDSDLTTLAGLTATTNNFIVSVGSAWASRTPAQVKTTLAIANTDVSGLGTLSTQNGTFSGTSSGTNTGDQNLFSNIPVSGQTTVTANSATTALTLVGAGGLTITTDNTTKTITFTQAGGGGGTVTNVASADGSITVTNPTSTVDLAVVKAPKLTTARTIGGVSFDGTANITVSTATAGFTISGGDLALGANNITMTGSLGATGARLTKGWFTDLQVTNAINGAVTGNAGTVSNATFTTALTVNTGTLTLTANAANTSVLTIGAGAVSVSGSNTGDQTTVSGNAGTATALQNARTLWGQSFDGTGNISGSQTGIGDMTGGASSMTITAGTGNSRTLTLRSTTSGGTATAFLTGNADQSSTFGGNISGTGAWNITGGAGNMTILSGTGASRTMIFQTTTSGSAATTALTLNADQTATFAAGITVGGTLAVGVNSITMSGSIGVTGTRVTKLWATDIESTNMPTVGGTAILTSLTAPQFTTIELGAASDTTLSRVSAGVIAVEGVNVLLNGGALGTPSSGTGTNITGITAAHVVAGTFGTGSYTIDTQLTVPQLINTANAITASGNAATIPVTQKHNIVTNNSAATLTITLTTTSAVNMQMVVVQILDFSAVAQTITWVNTENSTVTAPVTSNGSTTLPLTVGFIYNTATSKWRCIASA